MHTVQSVYRQTYTDWELCISDHGSTDNTLDILNQLDDSRVRVTSLRRGGRAEDNWNASVQMARGQFTKLLCQDDLLMPHCLGTQVSALTVHPNCSFTFGDRTIVSPRGRKLLPASRFSPESHSFNIREALPTLVRSGTNIFGEPCAVLMRSDALQRVGRFQGSYLIDLTMWIRLLRIAPAFYTRSTVAAFRISQQSWSRSLRDEQSKQIMMFFSELSEMYPDDLNGSDMKLARYKARSRQDMRQALIKMVELLKL